MSDSREEKPPVPSLFTVAAVLVAVALIAGAFVLGRSLGADGTDPATSPSPEPASLQAPQQLGALPLTSSRPPEDMTGVDKDILQSTYTDGTQEALLIQSRPETDAQDFLTSAGIADLQDAAALGVEIEEGAPTILCGISEDTQSDACGRVVEGEGQLLLSVAELEAAEVAELLAGA